MIQLDAWPLEPAGERKVGAGRLGQARVLEARLEQGTETGVVGA